MPETKWPPVNAKIANDSSSPPAVCSIATELDRAARHGIARAALGITKCGLKMSLGLTV
jgi:hypothetical protein